MASVNFTRRVLQQLASHDVWRVSNDWEPMALEIYDAVQSYFHPHNPDEPPHFMPGRPAKLNGGPVDLRMVTVPVRSKPFLVFFRYHNGLFQVRRVHHPRSQ